MFFVWSSILQKFSARTQIDGRTGVFETQKGESGEDAARKVESRPASEWA